MAAGDPSSEELRIAALEAELDAMRGTLSWRVTRPLRAVRRRTRPVGPSVVEPVPDVRNGRSAIGPTDDDRVGMARRIAEVRTLFATEDGRREVGDRIADPVAELVDDLERAELPDGETAWLALVAATGRYPLPGALAAAQRVVRREGAAALAEVVERALEAAVAEGAVRPAVEIVRDRVLVDVTQTTSQDLHSGIQRVARECAGRWLARSDAELVHFDETARALVRLSDPERDRAVNWQDHLHESGAHISRRDPEPATGATVVPWRCRHVIPEYVESGTRVDAYVAARDAGITGGVSMVVYDLIPITASELTYPGSTQSFGRYLSLVKRAGVLSAISASTGRELQSFLDGVSDQGLPAPRVVVRPLPSGHLDVAAAELDATREELSVGEVPLILAVGSHEPRKNHVMIVEAAERLWRAGRSFELLLVGAFAWETEALEAEVRRLADDGCPVRMLQRVDERTLWALYHLASFTVFISLVEGFGLPVAESLRCGTPVVTSGYGSMAEIAAGGGAVQVDPRDVASVAAAMGTLLDDPDALAVLRTEAAARSWPEWSDYADAVWADLVTSVAPDDGFSGGGRSARPS